MNHKKLVEELGAMEIGIRHLAELYSTLKGTRQSLDEEDKKLKQKQQIAATLTKEKEISQQKLTQAIHNRAKVHNSIGSILKGEEITGLQQKVFKAQNTQKSILEIIELFKQLHTQVKQKETINKQIVSLSKEITKGQQQLSLRKKEQHNKAQQVDLLEKNMLLLTRIQTLEGDRKSLEDEMPCPLCGSKDHPYNRGNIPELSRESKLLQETQKKLHIIDEQVKDLTHQGLIATERKLSCSERVDEITIQSTATKKNAEHLLSTTNLPLLHKITLPILQQQSQDFEILCQQFQTDLSNVEKLNLEFNKAENKQEKLDTKIQSLDKELLEASHQVSSINTEKQRIELHLKTLSTELHVLNNDLSQKLTPYGYFTVAEKQIPSILAELKQRHQDWKGKKEEEKLLQPKLIQVSTSIETKTALCKQEETRLTVLKQSCTLAQKELNDLQQQRRTLFADKVTTEEEKLLEQSVTDARKSVEKRRLKTGTIEKELTAINTLRSRLDTEATVRKDEIIRQQNLFKDALRDSPFADTEQFVKAIIAPHDLKSIQELNRKLQDKETEFTALINEKSTNLDHEKKKKLCTESETEIEEQVIEQEKRLQSLQEITIKSKEQITRNSSDKLKSTSQLTIIAAQKKKLSSWSTLHMLIGSADGKKFRNFAQGLTFEMMVHHANNHLQKMSDRYILVRDKTEPLDLNVIDTYQAGEIRSTKNLSGGESFLVSLALALGLSRMASHNVRVDSLFLDEGFGTLDENALESALDTLAQLREENKLIGVISHVAALKDRVPLQIEIIPGSRGNSTISGPGVTREA